MSVPPRLLLLSRPGCGLCHEMAEALDVAFGADAFELEWADVDSRPEWKQRWGLVIPVLLDADGRVICETRFDAARAAVMLGRPLRRGQTR
ncbi:MAG TPA: glutaredoxin family protein [Nevskiaceae bacterium]